MADNHQQQASSDLFAHKSKDWDSNSTRVQNATAIAAQIIEHTPLNKSMRIMDLGAGTGLLSYFVAPHVGHITALDNSPSMLESFAQKQQEFACSTHILQADIMQESVLETLANTFDGIISSMTIHHIEDTQALLKNCYHILKSHGFIALADLDTEDGSFHDAHEEGVFHHGFNRDALIAQAKQAGFSHVRCLDANTLYKDNHAYGVFVLLAIKTA